MQISKLNNKEPDFRILFFADSHLGFDYVRNPRVKKPRRGEDFFRNYYKILDLARELNVNLILHGGDLFYCSKIPQWLSHMVFEPLWNLADDGIPICIIPGNHERSTMPHGIYALYNLIYTFEEPKTIIFENNGLKISISGFPFKRIMNKDNFYKMTLKTGYKDIYSDFRIIAFHQIVEASKVEGYTFLWGDEVIPSSAITEEFDLYLTGHIHRPQIITHSPRGRKLPAEVIYPGSLERTSLSEKDETKGFYIIDFYKDEEVRYEKHFIPLETRPMHRVDIDTTTMKEDSIEKELLRIVEEIPKNSNIQFRVYINPINSGHKLPTTKWLRENVYSSLIVSIKQRMKPFE